MGKVIYVPDDEVDFELTLGALIYTYSTGIPFGNMRVREYYAYQTALAKEAALKPGEALAAVGFRRKTSIRMRRLSVTEYRQLQIAVRIRADTGRVVLKGTGKDISAYAGLKKALGRRGVELDVLSRGNVRAVNGAKMNKLLAARGLKFAAAGL